MEIAFARDRYTQVADLKSAARRRRAGLHPPPTRSLAAVSSTRSTRDLRH